MPSNSKKHTIMKYAIRAVKYFLYITVIFAAVIWVFSCVLHHRIVTAPADILENLEHGLNSVWMILGVFAAVSALYPMMGYMRRKLDFAGSIEDLKPTLLAFMEERGYEFEKETEGMICFRLRNKTSRISRTWEDRVTVSQSAAGLEMEGLRKDVARLANGLEYRVGRGE